MTVCDLIYIIGCGVAYLMAVIGLIAQEQLNGHEPKTFRIIFISFIPALLSWSLPIWWLLFKFFVEKQDD